MTYGSALAALADPTRRQVFERLRKGPQAVGELADRLPVSRPAVSQHLKVLKEAGLVADRPEGTRRVYFIDPKGLGQITRTITVAPVKKTLRVNAPQTRAFEVFTARFESWWPKGHHIGKAEMKHVFIEPMAGGRWYEEGVDGSECDWGKVLAWDPPSRLVLSWHLNGQFQYDETVNSEIEVHFIAEGAGVTRVELEHRITAADAELIRAGVDSPNGWTGLLASYQAAVGGN
jgi:DNA-binding transcriptional ArsR family regulator